MIPPEKTVTEQLREAFRRRHPELGVTVVDLLHNAIFYHPRESSFVVDGITYSHPFDGSKPMMMIKTETSADVVALYCNGRWEDPSPDDMRGYYEDVERPLFDEEAE